MAGNGFVVVAWTTAVDHGPVCGVGRDTCHRGTAPAGRDGAADSRQPTGHAWPVAYGAGSGEWTVLMGA